MPEAHRGVRAHEIEVSAAVDVRDPRAFAMRQHDRQRIVVARRERVLRRHQLRCRGNGSNARLGCAHVTTLRARNSGPVYPGRAAARTCKGRAAPSPLCGYPRGRRIPIAKPSIARTAHAAVRADEPLVLGGHHATRSEAPAHRLELAHYFRHFDNAVRRHVDHDRAAPRLHLDDASRRELKERLAQRRARYVEALRQLDAGRAACRAETRPWRCPLPGVLRTWSPCAGCRSLPLAVLCLACRRCQRLAHAHRSSTAPPRDRSSPVPRLRQPPAPAAV